MGRIKTFYALIFASLVFLSGCDPLEIGRAADVLGDSIDESTRAFLKAVSVAGQESKEWRGEIDKLGNRFEMTAKESILDVGTQSRMFVDFALRRLKANPKVMNDLTNMLDKKQYGPALVLFQKLQDANPLGEIAEIGEASPTSLSMDWISETEFRLTKDDRTVRFNGWDIPIRGDALKAEVRDADDRPLRDVSRHLKAATRYDALLDVSQGSGVKFTSADHAILISHRGKQISQLPITWGPAYKPPPKPKVTKLVLYVGTSKNDKDREITFHYTLHRPGDPMKIASLDAGDKEVWDDDKKPEPSWRHFVVPIDAGCEFEKIKSIGYRFHVRYSSSDGNPNWIGRLRIDGVLDNGETVPLLTETDDFEMGHQDDHPERENRDFDLNR